MLIKIYIKISETSKILIPQTWSFHLPFPVALLRAHFLAVGFFSYRPVQRNPFRQHHRQNRDGPWPSVSRPAIQQIKRRHRAHHPTGRPENINSTSASKLWPHGRACFLFFSTNPVGKLILSTRDGYEEERKFFFCVFSSSRRISWKFFPLAEWGEMWWKVEIFNKYCTWLWESKSNRFIWLGSSNILFLEGESFRLTSNEP